MSGGNLIPDAVSAIGVMIAFYYGLTGFACAWYYRKDLTSSARNLWMQGILPVVGGLMLYFILGWSLYFYWQPVEQLHDLVDAVPAALGHRWSLPDRCRCPC